MKKVHLNKNKINWVSLEAVAQRLSIDPKSLLPVIEKYPFRANFYFLELAIQKGEPLLRQVIPDLKEIQNTTGMEDPLSEDLHSPVPHLTHRYPDRVLFCITYQCAVYCRFCTRKRKIGHTSELTEGEFEKALQYIRGCSSIRDVLISGGDPLLVPEERLEWLLRKLKEIPHVECIRIGTRLPCTYPAGVTSRLVRILKKIRPLYFNFHFNHPDELTEASKSAIQRLLDAGGILGNQTVLLRGINDRAETLAILFRKLLSLGVRPYYLLQADLTLGTEHFRTRIETGLAIMAQLRGFVSGMAVPTYVIDLPGGGGKVPVLPEYVIQKSENQWVFRNYLNQTYVYPQVQERE